MATILLPSPTPRAPISGYALRPSSSLLRCRRLEEMGSPKSFTFPDPPEPPPPPDPPPTLRLETRTHGFSLTRPRCTQHEGSLTASRRLRSTMTHRQSKTDLHSPHLSGIVMPRSLLSPSHHELWFPLLRRVSPAKLLLLAQQNHNCGTTQISCSLLLHLTYFIFGSALPPTPNRHLGSASTYAHRTCNRTYNSLLVTSSTMKAMAHLHHQSSSLSNAVNKIRLIHDHRRVVTEKSITSPPNPPEPPDPPDICKFLDSFQMAFRSDQSHLSTVDDTTPVRKQNLFYTSLFCFENREATSEDVVHRILVEARSWKNAQISPLKRPANYYNINRLTSTNNSRSASSHSHICFFDVAWQATTLKSRIGWVISSPNEEIIFQGSAGHSFVSSTLMAEPLALKAAVLAASLADIQHLQVFLDSLSRFSLLNSNGVVNELENGLLDIRHLLGTFPSILFLYVSRSDNLIANGLAKETICNMYQN